jgi:hypothetical protein
MATQAARRVLRVPGRLVSTPTNLSAAYPYGGTELGGTNGLTVRCFAGVFPLTAWELGGVPIEYLHRGSAWGVAGFLRGADDDAMSAIFPNSANGAVTQHTLVTEPGSVAAGHRLSPFGLKLLFVPRDIARAPAWLLYRAIPMLEDQAELDFATQKEFGIPALFMGIPDTSGRDIQIGRLEDLSL